MNLTPVLARRARGVVVVRCAARTRSERRDPKPAIDRGGPRPATLARGLRVVERFAVSVGC